ncbi:MAG TPA: transposase, partial [Candidatus Methylomirabilis sp.]
LTRYIHLNPLRAGVVRDLAALDRYPWAGHSGLLGRRRHPWQATDAILGHFGRRVGEARRRYRRFVAEGIAQGRRPELLGGGLRRSAGGWEGLAALRRGRERWAFDERVLGRGPFVDRLLAALPADGPGTPARAWRALPRVLARVAKIFGVTAPEVTAGSRRRPVAAARAAIGAVAVTGLGLPVTLVARALGVTPMPLLRGFPRGRMLLAARKLDLETLARDARKG